jgi:ABC-type branched-subunit amino acid transport system substrate-binding protein
MLKFTIIITIIVFLLFGSFFMYSNNNNNVNYVEIGVITTLDGNAGSFGLAMLDLLNLSFTDINNNGGISGMQVKLVVKNGGCSKNVSEKAARELVKKGIKIIVGGACSDETLGAVLVTEPNKIIFISPTSRSHEITNSGGFVFRDISSTKEYITFFTDYIFNFDGVRTVAVYNEYSAFTESLKSIFKKRFVELGGEIILDDSFIIGDGDIDFTIFLDNLNNSREDIEGLYLNFQSEFSANAFLFAYRKYNFTFQIYNDEMFAYNSIYKKNKLVLNGTKLIVNDLPGEINKLNILSQKFKDFYKWDYVDENNFIYSAASYDLPYILKESIEDGNCDFSDTICIRDNLYGLENFTGFSGNISFDEFGDISLPYKIKVLGME